MIHRKFVNGIAVTFAVAGMMLPGLTDLAKAAAVLKNGESVSGYIRTNSPNFTFKNQSIRNAPTQRAYGEEYIFNAQQGDSIVVSVDVEDGSSLVPVIVLVASPTGAQVAYDDRSSLLRYRVPTTGEYKLRVLGRNNSLGRYKVSVSGLTANTTAQTPTTPQPTTSSQTDQRRRFLQNEYGLQVLDSCPTTRSGLVVAYFTEYGQTYTYCANPNRFFKAGDYIYDVSANELKPGTPTAQTSTPTSTQTATTDSRKQVLQREYGLTVLESCPTVTSSLVVVSFPEYGQTYRYCANPTRLVKAGEYTYDLTSGDLKPGAPIAQTPTSTQATGPDTRKQLLQNDYGLAVLDNCPASRTTLVVVNFPEGGQTYTYCANPNRVFNAGEYTYNAKTRNLDAAVKPQQCAVSVAGVCIVK